MSTLTQIKFGGYTGGVLLIYFLSYFDLFAQNHYYNTVQYGGTASLISGAAVSGTPDNASIYYNPAATAIHRVQDLSMSSNLYGITLLKVFNGAGLNQDFNSNKVNLFPQLLAGRIPSKKSDRLFIGYTLLTRNDNVVEFNARNNIYKPSSVDNTPDTLAVAAFDWEEQLTEQWGGLNLSYRLNSNWAIGGTFFLAYRQHKFSSRSFVRIVNLSNSITIGTGELFQRFRSNTLGMLLKLGVHWKQGPIRLGGTITTPKLNLDTFIDKGTLERELLILNIHEFFGANDIILIDRQEKLKTRHKQPWEIAFGAAYQLKRTALYFSVNYYTAVSIYTLLDPKPPSDIVEELLSSTDFLSVRDGARSITNISVGAEHRYGSFTLLGGFRTNLSNYLDIRNRIGSEIVIAPGVGRYNLYYLTAGVGFQKGHNSVHIGIDYGFSKKSVAPFADDLTSINNFFGFQESEVSPEVKLNQINLILSFTHYLKTGD
ncbi:hypothetical protein V6R21_09405 [Limibacter armeniacum]|uniref:hypothetical protein n=1 Tax=Limibacter armeniacum TaxID=466084 RepID=UPI002FE5BDB2